MMAGGSLVLVFLLWITVATGCKVVLNTDCSQGLHIASAYNVSMSTENCWFFGVADEDILTDFSTCANKNQNELLALKKETRSGPGHPLIAVRCLTHNHLVRDNQTQCTCKMNCLLTFDIKYSPFHAHIHLRNMSSCDQASFIATLKNTFNTNGFKNSQHHSSSASDECRTSNANVVPRIVTPSSLFYSSSTTPAPQSTPRSKVQPNPLNSPHKVVINNTQSNTDVESGTVASTSYPTSSSPAPQSTPRNKVQPNLLNSPPRDVINTTLSVPSVFVLPTTLSTTANSPTPAGPGFKLDRQMMYITVAILGTVMIILVIIVVVMASVFCRKFVVMKSPKRVEEDVGAKPVNTTEPVYDYIAYPFDEAYDVIAQTNIYESVEKLKQDYHHNLPTTDPQDSKFY